MFTVTSGNKVENCIIVAIILLTDTKILNGALTGEIDLGLFTKLVV